MAAPAQRIYRHLRQSLRSAAGLRRQDHESIACHVAMSGHGLATPNSVRRATRAAFAPPRVVCGYLFNLIYDLSPARLGRGGRWVALFAAVHGTRV
jgi:hypothetical protein